MERKSRNPVALWLFACAGMVFIMAVIGAITRLTESGLSIAEWKPLSGALPPLSTAEWERVFGLYKNTPQYREVFTGMDLAGFKSIFWWEWLHRFWGRLIGLAFALPLVWFWLRGYLTTHLKRRLLLLLGLGALQGFVGWFMVASGLTGRPEVSHYRLALHLSLALLLYALLLQAGVAAQSRPAVPVREALRQHALATFVLLSLTIVWGAFTAGLDAGKIYNEWPLMGGRFIPAEAMAMAPVWLNPTENHALVQFIHRWLAIATALAVLGVGWRSRLPFPRLAPALVIMAFIQPLLGVLTLLLGVPVWLGALHQAGALALLGLLTLWLARAVRA